MATVSATATSFKESPSVLRGNEKPSTEISPIETPGKENDANTSVLEQLNRSESLSTSYMPETPTRRCSSRTRHTLQRPETPTSSSALSTPLKDSPQNISSPRTMHFFDLSTPVVKSTRKAAKSTPLRKDNTLLKSAIKNSTIKKIEATPNRRELKFVEDTKANESLESMEYSSAVDVSSEFEDSSKEVTPKGQKIKTVQEESINFEGLKRMLKTPAKKSAGDLGNLTGVRELMLTPDRKPENAISDVLGERQLMKTPETKPTNDFSDVSVVAGLLKTPLPAEEDTDDKEYNDLMESITSVLGEEVENISDESLDKQLPERMISDRTQDVTASFDKVLDANPRSVEPQDIKEDENIEMELFEGDGETLRNDLSVDTDFNNLIGRPSISRTYSANKKTPETPKVDENGEEVKKRGETVLKWLEGIRVSIANEGNNTEQVLSARYSNVTPNESIAQSNDAPETYDVTTPRVSILQTVSSLRKNVSASVKKLTMSPVARLSLINNSTEIVENYQLNTDFPKSLRSTRKNYGSSMALLNNVSTYDANETVNSVTEVNSEANQTQPEESDILSLDAQPQTSTEIRQAVEQPILSNNFIQFAKSNDEAEETETTDVYEISSSDGEKDEAESEDSEESETEESEEEIQEIFDSQEIPPQMKQFHLSKDELEDGINVLDVSQQTENNADEDDDDLVTPSTINISSRLTGDFASDLGESNMTESNVKQERKTFVEIPATEDVALELTEEFHDDPDDVEIPATQLMEESIDENGANEIELHNAAELEHKIKETEPDDSLQLEMIAQAAESENIFGDSAEFEEVHDQLPDADESQITDSTKEVANDSQEISTEDEKIVDELQENDKEAIDEREANTENDTQTDEKSSINDETVEMEAEDTLEIPATQMDLEVNVELPETAFLAAENDEEAVDQTELITEDDSQTDLEKSLIKDDTNEMEAEQTLDEMSATQADLYDSKDHVELPESQHHDDDTFEENSQGDSAIGTESSMTQGRPRESILFSDSSFSRVDINPELLVTDSDGKLIAKLILTCSRVI